MNAIVTTNKNSVSNLKIREKILDFETEIRKSPDALIGDNYLCPLKHSFADGVYIREMFHPKGLMVVGKIHKQAHASFIMEGEVTVVSEEGKRRIKAPNYFIAPAGTKRAVYAHEDTKWITIHHNPDNLTDVSKLEDILIAESYSDYENSKIEKSKTKSIKGKSSKMDSFINNCGLIALSNLTESKNISFRTLINLAKDNALNLYPYKVSVKELQNVPLPAILHTDNHFVYVGKGGKIDSELKYTGNILLTKKSNYTEIDKLELKNITGGTWVSAAAFGAYAAGAGLLGAGIGAASKDVTECGRKCRAKCNSEYSFLQFGAKSDCKKNCKTKCFSTSTESGAPPPNNTLTTVLIVLIILTIIGLIWWALKSRK